jgi:hypothetical protein
MTRAITNPRIDVSVFIWLVIPTEVPKVVPISINKKLVSKSRVCGDILDKVNVSNTSIPLPLDL